MLLRHRSSGLILSIIFTLIISSNQCHYSCKECEDKSYNKCTKCFDNKSLVNSYHSTPAKGYCLKI